MAIGETYEQFIEKFKPKLTTDDCYTPADVYDCIKEWAVKEYELDDTKIIRPFYPGGDYENHEYPPGCVVLDNPPFSILSKIVDFYEKREIHYFLFAPSLTLFNVYRGMANYVIIDADITYENGAKVKTGFVTNMGEYKIRSANALSLKLNELCEPKSSKKRHAYPENVISSALLIKYLGGERDIKIKAGECCFVRKLDAQDGTGIYGAGFIVSDHVTERLRAERLRAERLRAERLRAATEYALSEREIQIIQQLNRQSD